MISRIQRAIRSLDLEERILNGASIFALVSIFLPWISGELLGQDFVSYSGFEFFTSFIGILVFLLHATLLMISAVPLFGGPIVVRRRHKDFMRLCLSLQATILTVAALSVLTKVTYDYTRMEIRFGIYFTFIGSLVSSLYAAWKYQEFRKSEDHDVFRHPEDQSAPMEDRMESNKPLPPPPPPPPPLAPEEHHLRS